MATRIVDYDPSITEPSRLELVSIARWLKDNSKTVYLVGGWAVYYHTKASERPPGKFGEAIFDKSKFDDPLGFAALGSKDIDLIFETKAAKEEFEEKYCRQNGYRKSGPTPKELVKHIGKIGVILDPDLLSNFWNVRKTKVGWKDLVGHHAKLELDDDASILAPTKELLLLYKCIALVERTDDRGKPNQNVVRLDSKIWKDANDILALHDTGINAEALESLAKDAGFAGILAAAKQIISENYENYGFRQYAFAKKFLEGKN